MHKQAEITDRTRQNLVEAFWSLYSVKRIEKITVREVANKAGYNRGTFYEYFRDLYAVLEYVEEQSLPTLEELPPLLDTNKITPAFAASFMDLYRGKFKYYDVLLGDNGDPAFQRKLKNSLKSSLIQSLSKKGSVNLVEIDLLLEYILSGLIGILIYSFQNKPELSDEELVSTLYGLLHGDMVGKLQHLIDS